VLILKLDNETKVDIEYCQPVLYQALFVGRDAIEPCVIDDAMVFSAILGHGKTSTI
jgi:hypothetical protein